MQGFFDYQFATIDTDLDKEVPILGNTNSTQEIPLGNIPVAPQNIPSSVVNGNMCNAETEMIKEQSGQMLALVDIIDAYTNENNQLKEEKKSLDNKHTTNLNKIQYEMKVQILLIIALFCLAGLFYYLKKN
jgi:hypothetical protein